MEIMSIELSDEKFDAAVHGLGGPPALPQASPCNVYVKAAATEAGKAGCVITFLVQLPDGTLARAQGVVTAALFEGAAKAVKGWREGGHIQ